MMDKFKYRPRTLEEVLLLCKEQNLEVDVASIGSNGYVTVRGGGAFVHYSPVTGNFIGITPEGVRFHAANGSHRSKEWFIALLNLFHEEIVI